MAGQLSMVQWLIGLSCNINAADAQGQTSLIAAVACGHKAVVTCLLDVSCDALATNASLQSALHVASAACSSTMLSLLLPHWCEFTQSPQSSFQYNIMVCTQYCSSECIRCKRPFAPAASLALEGFRSCPVCAKTFNSARTDCPTAS
jgi:hypothetical protein